MQSRPVTREPSPVASAASSETQAKLELLQRELNGEVNGALTYEQKRIVLEETADRLGVPSVRGAGWQLASIAGAICKFPHSAIVEALGDALYLSNGAAAFDPPREASKDERLLQELERARKQNIEILSTRGDSDLIRGFKGLPEYTWPRSAHNITRGLQHVANFLEERVDTTALKTRLLATGRHVTLEEHVMLLFAFKVLDGAADAREQALAIIAEISLVALGDITPETATALRLARLTPCVSAKEFSEWVAGEAVPGLSLPTRNTPRSGGRTTAASQKTQARVCRVCGKNVPAHITFSDHQGSRFCTPAASTGPSTAPKNGAPSPAGTRRE